MNPRPALALTAVLAAVVVAGCGGTENGSPTTAPPTTSAGAPPSPGGSNGSGTQRPGEIDLAGADPCAAVTEQQAAAWAVDRAPIAKQMGASTAIAGAPSCVFGSSAEQTTFLIATSGDVGLPDFVEATPPSPTREEVEVDGFPAVVQEGVTSAPERGSGECYAVVDVADGQLLLVQFSQVAAGADKRLPLDSLCAKAREVAAAALTTLQGG
ncbi:MAG TPA: DUF3558 family protein [Pseudonocardiaceae bacterium]